MIQRFFYAFSLLACTLLLLLIAANTTVPMPLHPAHRITLHGADFRVLSGAGEQDEESLNIGSVGDDDNAVQSIALDHVGADDFPLLRYSFANFPRTLELSLVFRCADTPKDVHAIALPRPEGGVNSYDLRTVPAWHGDILEVGFAEFPTAQSVAKGQGFHPFTLIHAELWSPSKVGAVSALLTDWFAHWPWSLRSVNALGRDIDTPRNFSLVLALAVWSFIALLLGILILGWRGRSIGIGAFACIAIAWLLLDLSWQSGLFWKLGLTRDLYAEKSWEERSRMIADAPLLEVAARVRETMRDVSPNTRVLVASDSDFEMRRLVYHLLPANVAPLALVTSILAQADTAQPTNSLPTGTVLVYYDVAASDYDAALGKLHIAGVDYAARALLETRSLRIYRIGDKP